MARSRESLHVRPNGLRDTFRHHIRVIGALRSAVTVEGWLASGLEMLGLGVVVAAAAYASGALIASLID